MKRSKDPYRFSSSGLRFLAGMLIPVLFLTSFPVQGWTITRSDPAPTTRNRLAPTAPSAARPHPLRAVNRTWPKIDAPPLGPVFSPQPTEAEIRQARVFEEPLIPMGGPTQAAENKALAKALLTYLKRGDNEDVSAITGFLARYPRSAWRAALLTNLGLVYRRTGSPSQARTAWEEAWRLSKYQTELQAQALADRTVGELADLHARLGAVDRLQPLLTELQGRDLRGPATERITGAREALWRMQHRPEESFRCGPYALQRILISERPTEAGNAILRDARATPQGLSLVQLAALVKELGMPYQMAQRAPGARLILPAVVHWKVGHYGALLQEQNGRYLLKDPTYAPGAGSQLWIRPAVLEAEASGYFLVPKGKLPAGWRPVSPTEGATVWGKGYTSGPDPDGDGPDDDQDGGDGPCGGGMAHYNIHMMLISLHIMDTPVGYTPPRGPAMKFTVSYNQREANQPANFSYSNLGPKWTFSALSYIADDPNTPTAAVKLFRSGGGTETHTGFVQATQSYAPHLQNGAVVVRTSTTPIRYERRLPDGSKEVFDRPDGATIFPRKIFLTQSVDALGNTVTYTYDAQLRLTSMTDALNQVTTLSYQGTADVRKITKVTDPFGRSATFEYDATGQLTRITDVLGLTSVFEYDTGNFIKTMTTPYGTTAFAKEEAGNRRALQATDPLGDTERAEFREQAPGIGFSDPFPPTGIPTFNSFLNGRTSFYWNKKAGRDFPNDYTKARMYHWLHDFNTSRTSRILESLKEPLENRVWYYYPGQTSAGFLGGTAIAKPAITARVLDDGTTQLYRFEYNRLGKLTKATDPVGRVTSYIYAANDIDLLEVRQQRGAGSDVLTKYTYNAQHLPLTAADTSGQTTTFTYNSFGQLLTTTNARGETTTLAYDANGYLISVTRPVDGATTTFAYDPMGRMQTVTDPDGYGVTLAYDALDRLTTATYPDGTFQQLTYDRLDTVQGVDRLGRTSQWSYNARRQMTSLQDAAGRVTRLEWCTCGGLQKVVDPLGRETTFNRDVQGRVTSKVFPDGREIQYTYEGNTSRLVEQTDAKGQTKRYQYYPDDTLQQVSYPDAPVTTAAVRFTYDPNYKRLLTMQDGIGQTTYAYNPITPTPTLGAGRLASVSGPLPNVIVALTYDELGRVVSRAINGVVSSVTYNTLGRVVQADNPLGTFTYGYSDPTDRLTSATYPNGQSTTFSYYDATGDLRLQQIQNLNPDASPLSQFSYTYNAEGQITDWIQQAGMQPPAGYTFTYDPADQLLTATRPGMGAEDGGSPSRYVYTYDNAGNRTSEQVDAATTSSSFNNLNQLISQDGTLPPDTIARRSEVQYDGLGRRVHLVERENGIITSEKFFVWCDRELCEERDGTGQVTKRFYAQGVEINGDPYYYTRDHLGSIRELTDATGAIRARYNYDPYGRRTKVSGDLNADLGFTNHYFHPASGLHLAPYRGYDANLGRWISRDPIEERGGLNLYAYVDNNPAVLIDPTGELWSWAAVGIGAAIGAVGGLAGGLATQGVSYLQGGDFSWRAVGSATLGGAVGGAVVGAITGAVTGDPSALAVGGSYALAGGLAAAGGALSGGIGQALGPPPPPRDNGGNKDKDKKPCK